MVTMGIYWNEFGFEYKKHHSSFRLKSKDTSNVNAQNIKKQVHISLTSSARLHHFFFLPIVDMNYSVSSKSNRIKFILYSLLSNKIVMAMATTTSNTAVTVPPEAGW